MCRGAGIIGRWVDQDWELDGMGWDGTRSGLDRDLDLNLDRIGSAWDGIQMGWDQDQDQELNA